MRTHKPLFRYLFIAFLFFAGIGKLSAQCSASFTYTTDASNPADRDTLYVTSTSTSGSPIVSATWSLYVYYQNAPILVSTLSGSSQTYTQLNPDSSYKLCLRITDSAGCTSTTCQNIATQPCNITASMYLVNSGSSVLAYNTSAGNIQPFTSYWTFQGGTPATSTAQNPSVTYTTPGIYQVCLVTTGFQGCVDSICRFDTITSIPCHAYFYTYQLSTDSFLFVNASVGGWNNATINFGDGTSAPFTDSIRHTYGLNGSFPVTVSISDTAGTCSDSIIHIVNINGILNDTLCGIAFVDSNQNGIFDPGERLLSHIRIVIDGSTVLYTDTAGFYMAFVGRGGHTVYASTPGVGWIFTTVNYYPVSTTNNDHLCGLYFGFKDVARCHTQADFTYGLQADNSADQDTISLSNTSVTGFLFDSTAWTVSVYNGTTYQPEDTSSQNTPVFYLAPDSAYKVCLFVHDTGRCTSTKCDTVLSGGCSITASFYYVNSGSSVLCYNTSTSNIMPFTSYWTFQGGTPSTSTAANPSVTFATAGTHQICLIVKNAAGCSDTSCQSVTTTTCLTHAWYSFVLHDNSSTNIDTAVLTNGSNPLGRIVSYDLDVYDSLGNLLSTTSSSSFPNTVLVPHDTVRTVCLTAHDSSGCVSTYCNNILPSSCSIAASFYSVNSSSAVLFYNTTTSNLPYSSYWTFPGGTPSSSHSNSPQVIYPASGTYPVCLVVTSIGGCTDTICQNVTVNIPCAAHFNFIDSLNVYTFYNHSTGSWTQATIDFGDGTSASLPDSITHIYTQNGDYYVSLAISDSGGVGCLDTILGLIHVKGIVNDTLCGIVFNDANHNTLFDFGETAVAGADIRIDGFDYYTDSAGYYRIAVTSGTHNISLISPFGWVQTYPTSPLSYTQVTTNNDYICGLDFGMRDDTLFLSGIVYDDNNGNGIFDGGDAPRSGVPVNINGTSGHYSAFTDSTGYWSQMVYSSVDTITYALPSGYVYTQPINPNYYVVTAIGSNIGGLNFGVRYNNAIISGIIYFDMNSNGVYDTGEPTIAGQPVHVGSSVVYSNSTGHWSIVEPLGSYTVTYTPNGVYSGYTPTPTSYSVSASTPGNNYSGNNFGLVGSPTGNVCLSLDPYTCVSPGFAAGYRMHLTNTGGVPVLGTVTLYYDANLTYGHSAVTPTSTNTSSRTISWHVSLNSNTVSNLDAWFTCQTGATIGATVLNDATFVPDAGYSISNPSCATDTLQQSVRASWDPNVKQVSPPGRSAQGLIGPNQELDYNVEFQNTGSAVAVNIIVIDTLLPELDTSTFELKAFSHECHVQRDGHQLTFIFSNIMLQPASVNYDSSFGFASFRIKPTHALPQGTIVNNTGNIYFDYNEDVVTNTTLNTIDYKVDVNELADHPVDIIIQPNPFSSFAILTVDGVENDDIDLTIYDMLGNTMRQQRTAGNKFRIDRADFASGVYLYQVRQGQKLIGTGKMVIE